MTYDEFMDKHGLSPSSPEAYYVELAFVESNEWISVNEVIPPNDIALDVWVDYGDYTGRVCSCFFDDEKCWKWDNKVMFKVNIPKASITHWMPLPEPPCKN